MVLEMMKMMKIDSPVLFDANILINFEKQLAVLFQFFDKILIHKQVYGEIITPTLKKRIDDLKQLFNIEFVSDFIPTDPIALKLFSECDKELKESFNISDLKDLGEYKTLLYAKFTNVDMLSSQDTTVWRFLTDSKYFRGIKCFTLQDLSFILFQNATCGDDRKIAKTLYNSTTKNEHPFDDFKIFVKRANFDLPLYIDFENNRIDNYRSLLQSYVEFYLDEPFNVQNEIETEVLNFARSDIPPTCISCLYSRADRNKIDYSVRQCSFNYSLNDENCLKICEFFNRKIHGREK
jgi:hypothetical protein